MDFSVISTVMSITVLCYLAGIVCKMWPAFENEWIPAVVGLLGCALGIVGMYVVPEFPASNVMDAMAVGVVSGLASTGANQIVKQLGKGE